MENLQHIKARIEREIEEVMGEKKWTPRHAEVIEELLSCEKCIKEIEKMAHAKKRMMGLPAPSEEEDEEMMEKPWHFGMYTQNDYARGGNNGRGGSSNYGYRRGPSGYRPYDYNMNRYEDDEDEFAMPNRRMPMNYNYEGNDYHHDPEYLIWLKKKKHSKKDWDDDDDEEEEEKLKKRMKKLWKQMQQEEHGFSNNYTDHNGNTSHQNTDGNQTSNQPMGRMPTGTPGK